MSNSKPETGKGRPVVRQAVDVGTWQEGYQRCGQQQVKNLSEIPSIEQWLGIVFETKVRVRQGFLTLETQEVMLYCYLGYACLMQRED
jgi:hypothetical protein